MKRTEELKRTPFRAKPMTDPKPPPGRRKRKCAVCREPFEPRNISHKVCAPECGLLLAEMVRKAQERKTDRERKQAMKTRNEWLADAQKAFNAWVRERDAALPCISCGRFHTGAYDAGHYRSVGAMEALRFEPLNVHRQCVPCNQHKAGNIIEYRIRLIERIGLAMVEYLERDHSPKKYTIDEAKEIRDIYRAKLRELKGEKT